MRRFGGKASSIITPLRVLALALVFALIGSVSALAAVTTDQQSYAPGSTVHITGDGMTPGATVNISILRPDQVTEYGQAIAADDGTFSYDYVLPGPDHPVYGTYYVTATDGTNTYTTTFADGVVTAAPLAGPYQSATDPNTCSTPFVSNPVPGDTVYVEVGPVTVQGGGTATFVARLVEPNGVTNPSNQFVTTTDGISDCLALTIPIGAPSGQWTVYTCAPAAAALNSCETNIPQGTFLDSLTFNVGAEPETPVVSTTPEDASNNPIGSVDAGSTVHDHIEVTTSSNAIPASSTVSLKLWKGPFTNGDSSLCTTGTLVKSGSDFTFGAPTQTTTKDWSWDSSGVAISTAGDYAFQATFTSSNTSSVTNKTGACEPFSVDAVNPSLTTETRNASNDSAATSFDLATSVYDHAVVSSTNGTPSGSVTFNLYSGATCADRTVGELTEAGTLLVGPNAPTLSTGAANSADSGALHAGHYYYLVTYTSDDTSRWNSVTTPVCEDFTVNQATPTVATGFENASNASISSPFALGTSLHDAATVTGIASPPDSSFNPSGTVDFTFYGSNTLGNSNTGDCTDTNSSSAGSATISSGTADGSSSVGPLHAGSYAFSAHYGGNNDYKAADSPCEPLTVNPASTTTTTTIKDAFGNTIGSSVFQGTTVHDTSSITSTNTSFPIGGTVNYSYFTNGTCTAPAAKTDTGVAVASGVGGDSSSETPAVGSFCFNAQYQGNGDYSASNSAIEPFSVVPNNRVTNSSLCPFDTDPSTPTTQQFNLIFTPDFGAPTYKLSASNPGQFYYNIFYVGTGGPITVTIPAGFVTQGAVPIHVYNTVTVGTGGCLVPGTEITNSSAQVTGPNATGSPLSITIPSVAGFAYVAIHLDYYYKGIADGCSKDSNTPPNATCTAPATPTHINNDTPYTFSWTGGPSGSSTIRNINIFKKDPGIGGLVTSNENPVVGATVKIYNGSKVLLATLTTDQDGWYMWAYKYTGSAATFVVTLPAYNKSQSVTLKSNGYLVVNFTV